MTLILLACSVFFPQRARSEEPAALEQDARLAFQARAALFQDPSLAPLNLGVTVRDRVAILWGPVPSRELARRAEAQLRSLYEFAGVKNELRVVAGDIPTPAPSPPIKPAPLPDPDNPKPATNACPPWRPAAPASPPQAPAKGRLTSSPARSEATSDKNLHWKAAHQPVEILPPIPIEKPARPSPVSPAPASLEQAVYQLQSREVRFQDIRVEVRGGLVFLNVPAGRSGDVFRLAQKIAELPGVERVVLRDNSPSSSR